MRRGRVAGLARVLVLKAHLSNVLLGLDNLATALVCLPYSQLGLGLDSIVRESGAICVHGNAELL